MSVFALKATSERGKTPTIILLDTLLRRNGYAPIPGHYFNHRNNDFMDIYDNASQKVGLVSRGDYPNLLLNDINYLFTNGCNKVICTSRTKGAVKQVVVSFTPHQFINKTIEFSVPLQLAANNTDAQILFNLL